MASLAPTSSQYAVHSIEIAADLLESRWRCIILFHLLHGSARFGELRRRVPAMTQRTLTNHLRALESNGLIERHIFAEVPVKVEYKISPLGRTIEPVLMALKCWGETISQAEGAVRMPH